MASTPNALLNIKLFFAERLSNSINWRSAFFTSKMKKIGLLILGLLSASCGIVAQMNPYADLITVNGITIFEDGKKSGIKNAAGKVVVKPNIFIKKHIGHGFVYGWIRDYKKGTETQLVYNPKGEIVSGPIEFKEYEEFIGRPCLTLFHFRKGLLNYTNASETGKGIRFGLMDSTGSKLTLTKYMVMQMGIVDSTNLILVKDETYPIGLYGYIDFAGKEVIKPQYKMATQFANDGKYALVKNDQWQVIDRSGKLVYTPPYNTLIGEDENELWYTEKSYNRSSMKRNGQFVMKGPDKAYHLLNCEGMDRVIFNDEYQDFIHGKLQAKLNREEYARQEEAVKIYKQQQAEKAARTGYYLVSMVFKFNNGDYNSNYVVGKDMDVTVTCKSTCIKTSNLLDAKTYATRFWPEYNNYGEQFKEYFMEACSSESDCHEKAQKLDKYNRTVHVNNASWKGSDNILGSHQHDMQIRILD